MVATGAVVVSTSSDVAAAAADEGQDEGCETGAPVVVVVRCLLDTACCVVLDVLMVVEIGKVATGNSVVSKRLTGTGTVVAGNDDDVCGGWQLW